MPTIKEGDKFGFWTIIRVESQTKVYCSCQCGFEKYLRSTDLLRGTTTKCTKCHLSRHRTDIVIGYKSGEWTVISVDDFKYQKSAGVNVEKKWHCRCSCGFEKWIRTCHLTGRKTLRCQKCEHISRGIFIGEIPISVINRFKEGSKARSIEWNLDDEFLWDLFLKQDRKCKLSGTPLSFSSLSIGQKRGRIETTASLDRIDSTKGYIKENIQWVHKDVNKMKMDLQQEKFIEYCTKISNHNKTK